MNLLSIIIVNYNTPELVYDCLRSIERFLPPDFYEVLIVENASPNAVVTAEKVAGFAKAHLIAATHNHGFGSGNNLGAKAAQGDLLWLLNSDTLLVDDSIIALCQSLRSSEQYGALLPLLYRNQALTDFQEDSYASFQTLTGLIKRTPRPQLNLNQEIADVEVAVAAAFVVKRAVFEAVGGFDETFFMFFEDDDLCKKIINSGKKIGIFTKSRIVHLQGKSITTSKERKKLYYQSQNYYWKKHHGLALSLVMQVLRLPYRLITRK